MNAKRVLLHTRKLLIAAAATVVAATCVVSVNPAGPTADSTRPALHQATKEWKTSQSSAQNVTVATKEWKVDPLRTKEW